MNTRLVFRGTKTLYHRIDFFLSKKDISLVRWVLQLFQLFQLQSSVINFRDPKLARAFLYITLAPVIWNIFARLEYFFHVISFLCFGKRSGCYVLALWIVSFSLYRDLLVMEAINSQPILKHLDNIYWEWFGLFLGGIGAVLVVSSFLRLGITGTFLGDYFGIYLDKKVSGFPFSICSNPMYDGSVLLFISKAVAKSPTGLFLSLWTYVMYRFA
eukprot:ctg_154.g69